MATKPNTSRDTKPADQSDKLFAAFPEPQGWAVGWDAAGLAPAPTAARPVDRPRPVRRP